MSNQKLSNLITPKLDSCTFRLARFNLQRRDSAVYSHTTHSKGYPILLQGILTDQNPQKPDSDP
jgi:hypothetical protein